jgi:flagellar hook-associated protein 1 FlgK
MTVPATPVLAGQGTFVPGQTNSLLTNTTLLPAPLAPGYDVVVSGMPENGDIINISYNNGGSGDNRNALLIAELQRTRTLANGRATYQDAYAQLVGNVGTRTRDAIIGQEAADSVLKQTQAQRDSVSGVNLDEEAADLIRFQNAYQASARIVQVSSEIFDAILGIR